MVCVREVEIHKRVVPTLSEHGFSLCAPSGGGASACFLQDVACIRGWIPKYVEGLEGVGGAIFSKVDQVAAYWRMPRRLFLEGGGICYPSCSTWVHFSTSRSGANGSVVLAELGVSVTCSIGVLATEWWLTRESGCFPPRCERGPSDCTVCTTRVGDASGVPPRAYVIVKADVTWMGEYAERMHTEFVSFGMLSEALEVVASRVVSVVRVVRAEEGRDGLESLFAATAHGSCTCKTECSCGQSVGLDPLWDGFFSSEVGSLLVGMPKFLGAYPCGDRHWFSGVSDAVGEVLFCVGGKVPWLLCPWKGYVERRRIHTALRYSTSP